MSSRPCLAACNFAASRPDERMLSCGEGAGVILGIRNVLWLDLQDGIVDDLWLDIYSERAMAGLTRWDCR